MASTGINLSEVRNFSDMFTATFYFIKQEIKSLLTCFSVLVLPLVLVDLFIKSYAMNGLFLLRSAEAMHQYGVRGMALLLFSYDFDPDLLVGPFCCFLFTGIPPKIPAGGKDKSPARGSMDCDV